MSEKIDLYATLGVSKTASDEEIRKAYKKLAIKHHPDRNPDNKEEANQKFLEISKSFKVLSDVESRKRYDQFGIIDGENDQGGAGMSGGLNPFDIFGNIFNGGFFGGMGGMGGQPEMNNRRNAKSPDKKITINLSLADVYNGKLVPLDFIRIICCAQCSGLGAKTPESIISCNICNGKGKIIKMMQMGPMIQQTIQNCGSCNGQGKMISKGNECNKCQGKKGVNIKRHLDCYVRPGSGPGTQITFKNESDWISDFGDIGDLIVFINCKNDEGTFRREGNNLIIKKTLSLLEALTNTTFYFKHLDDRVVKVSYNEIIHPNQKMIIRGEGMPDLQDNLNKGDLIINFDIVFPQSLDRERSKYLVKILPQPKKQIWDIKFESTPENELTIHTMEIFKENIKSTNETNTNSPYQDDLDEDSTNTFNHFKMGGEPQTGPIECSTQ
jgi:DnaJ family protein A protein 2